MAVMASAAPLRCNAQPSFRPRMSGASIVAGAIVQGMDAITCRVEDGWQSNG